MNRPLLSIARSLLAIALIALPPMTWSAPGCASVAKHAEHGLAAGEASDAGAAHRAGAGAAGAADAAMECCDASDAGRVCESLCVSCTGVLALHAADAVHEPTAASSVSPRPTPGALAAHAPPPFRPPISP